MCDVEHDGSMQLRPVDARSGMLVILLVLTAGCGSAGAPAAGQRVAHVVAERAVAGVGEERPAVRALRILRAWDRRRASAYAGGEPDVLRPLYARGSRAGARDVRVLRSYADRGLVVQELTMQVLEVRLLASSPGLVRLRVLERLAGGTIAEPGGGAGTALPTAEPRARVVTLVHEGGRWVVRAVRRG
jgi:hypothetical protein